MITSRTKTLGLATLCTVGLLLGMRAVGLPSDARIETSPDTAREPSTEPNMPARRDLMRRTVTGATPTRDESTGTWFAAKGVRLHFQARCSTTTTFQKRSTPYSPELTQTLAADLECEILDRKNHEIVFAFRIVDPVVHIVGQNESAVTRDFTSRLEGLSLVLMSDEGMTLGYRFPETMSEMHKQCVRSLVDCMRHVIPSSRNTIWETEEASASSLARYQYSQSYLSKEGKRTLRRRLLGLADDTVRGPFSMKAEGQAVSVFDEHIGWLRRTQSTQRLAITVPQLDSIVLSSTTIDLALETTSTVPPQDRALEVDWKSPWEPVTSAQDPAGLGREMVESRYAHRLQGKEASTIVQSIASMLRTIEGIDSKELRTAMKDLGWLLRLDSAQIAPLMELMLSDSTNHVLVSVLADALATAGTPECQVALFKLLGERGSNLTFRQIIARSMLYMNRPTEQSLDTVRTLTQSGSTDLRKTNLVLYGAFIRHVGSDSRHIQVLKHMEQSMKKSDSTREWLMAIGNARQPELDRLAETYLDHIDPDLRRAAINALNQTRSPALTMRFRALLGNEAQADIRCLLVTELADRGDIGSVLSTLERDMDAGVRRAALLALRFFPKNAMARKTLKNIARTGTTNEIRQIAQALLQGSRARK